MIFTLLLAPGWMGFSWSYLLLVLGIVMGVYLIVWALTWLQCKQDEEVLNALLKKRASGGNDRAS